MEMARVYTVCNKCGKPVPGNNDVAVFEALLRGDWTLYFTEPRHFLPTEDCEGSPSRAQYIEGQPRDPRPEYSYDERAESLVREIYSKMQNIDT